MFTGWSKPRLNYIPRDTGKQRKLVFCVIQIRAALEAEAADRAAQIAQMQNHHATQEASSGGLGWQAALAAEAERGRQAEHALQV